MIFNIFRVNMTREMFFKSHTINQKKKKEM